MTDSVYSECSKYSWCANYGGDIKKHHQLCIISKDYTFSCRKNATRYCKDDWVCERCCLDLKHQTKNVLHA